jgi:large subunit ribosomal protein L7Ae
MKMVDKELADKALEAVEVARSTGKLKKGTNEATKSLERGTAKLVVIAKDVNPPEITMHIPILAKEKGIPCVEVESKEELGTAAGVKVGTSAIAVIAEGNAKKVVAEIKRKTAPKEEPKEEKKEEEKPAEEAPKKEVKETKKEEAPKEEKKEEAPKKEAPKEEKKEEPKEEKKEGE